MIRIASCIAASVALGLAAPASAQYPAPAPAESRPAGAVPPSAGEPSQPAPKPRRIAVSARMMGQDEVTRTYDIGRLSDATQPDRLERLRVPRDRVAGVFVGPALLFTNVRDASSTAMVVGPPVDVEFQARVDTVRRALLENDLPGLVAQSLRQIAPAAIYDGDPPEGISVAVAFYGLRSQDDNPSIMEADDNYCFVAVGSAFSLVGGGAGPETSFMLTVLEPSPGIATPICASFLDLSERGAYRLRQVMEQSAENLAQWLVNGVLGGR
ncbi:MAG TPA: hypothetical protein VFP70_04740 [Burkholderiales bacterium]|nr:hypothetical protein [Burkholderiales bacterium]